MGIESTVRKEYGDAYWEREKKNILKQANRNHNLNTRRVAVNARDRRRARRAEEFGLEHQLKLEMERHPTLYNASDLYKHGVISKDAYKKIRNQPKRKWLTKFKNFFKVSMD